MVQGDQEEGKRFAAFYENPFPVKTGVNKKGCTEYATEHEKGPGRGFLRVALIFSPLLCPFPSCRTPNGRLKKKGRGVGGKSGQDASVIVLPCCAHVGRDEGRLPEDDGWYGECSGLYRGSHDRSVLAQPGGSEDRKGEVHPLLC